MESEPEQKNWYKSFLKWMRPYQFNWIGQTRDGVNRWIGAPKGPSERMCKYFIRYGIAMAIVGLLAAGAIMLRLGGSAPLGLLALIGGVHGLAFSSIGLWLRKMRQNLANLKTVEELAQEFGSTPETVRRLVEAHNIRARININDDNLYDPEEFLGSRSLLRGASAPCTPEILLRPAEPTAMRTASDTLLRPVEPAAVTLTPVQQLFYGTQEAADETEEVVQTLRH